MSLTVLETAELLGVSAQFIRLGLQQQRLPIGTAVKSSDNRWVYDIRKHLVKQYAGSESLKDMVSN